MSKFKSFDKYLANWLILFTIIAFLLEFFWSDVFTARIALYSCLINAIIMVAIKVVYEIVKKRKKK